MLYLKVKVLSHLYYKECRQEIRDLNAELQEFRTQPQDTNRFGNSLFAEVEDKRVLAEKKLIRYLLCFVLCKDTIFTSCYANMVVPSTTSQSLFVNFLHLLGLRLFLLLDFSKNYYCYAVFK